MKQAFVEAGNENTDAADQHERILELMMGPAKLSAGLCVAWLIIALVMQAWPVAAIAFACLLGILGFLALAHTRYNIVGRITWTIGANIAALGGFWFAGPLSGFELLPISLVGGLFLIFSVEKERAYILSFATLTILGWVAIWLGLRAGTIAPLVDPEMASTYFVIPAALTSFAMVGMQVGWLSTFSARRVRDLRESNNQALAANRAKSAFLATMSHEIRTPMNGVVGMIEVLENSEMTLEQRRMLGIIRQSSFALLRIIDDILDMSRIEAGKMELVPAQTHLLSIFEGAAEVLRPAGDKGNVSIALSFDPELPEWITCDAGRLRQIVLNLLGNAVKFTYRTKDEGRGFVELRVTRRDGDMMEIRISDTGIGMSDELIANLFKPFTQSDSSSNRKFAGTGLGLAIVHQLVGKMGGTIEVESRMGEGSVFTVTLPMVEPSLPRRSSALSGVKVIGMVTLEFQRTYWRKYIESCGGNVTWVDREEELYAAIQAEPGAVALLASLGPDGLYDVSVSHRFMDRFPNRRLLDVSADRGRRFGITGDHRYTIQCSPMMPSELVHAVHVISGRASPDEKVDFDLSETGVAAQQPEKKGGRVLVVEDNEINQMVLKTQLSGQGYEVVVASNGNEGLALVLVQDFDIILTDCHMPEMDGFEMTRAIRQSERDSGHARRKIIAVTANALAGEADRCLASGMDDYLAKPIKIDQLSRMLKKWRD